MRSTILFIFIGLMAIGCQDQSQFSADQGSPSFDGVYSLSSADQSPVNLFSFTVEPRKPAPHFLISEDHTLFWNINSEQEEKAIIIGHIDREHRHIHFYNNFVQQYWGGAYEDKVICKFIVESTQSAQQLMSTECSGFNKEKEVNEFLAPETYPYLRNYKIEAEE